MVNMFGAVIILLASTLAGFYKARQYALRPRQLRELIAALQRLMTEINYGLTPLPDAMGKMGAQTKEPVKGCFFMQLHKWNLLMDSLPGKVCSQAWIWRGEDRP